MNKLSVTLFSVLFSCAAFAQDVSSPTKYNPISVPEEVETAPIAFTGLIFDRSILDAKYEHQVGKNCTFSDDGDYEYGQMPDIPIEFSRRYFTSGLNKYNYTTVGGDGNLFKETGYDAKYLLAGRIVKLKHTYCSPNFRRKQFNWDRMNTKSEIQGQYDYFVEWQLFDSKTEEVIYKKEIPGTYIAPNTLFEDVELPQWYWETVKNSFEGLLSEQEFYDILVIKEEEPVFSFDGMAINFNIVDENSDGLTIADARKSVVTIRAEGGHGSGFVVSEDGYILTNQHVVDDLEEVTVIFPNGMEISGQVLRRSDKRDVALVKVPINRLTPLSLRFNEPDIGTEVYAIGSPLFESLSGTVSKGIISAFRMRQEQEYIQSDAQINGGNSGGPLIDEKGNVIAISVSGYDQGEGLNFFIPIKFALESLKLTSTE